MSREYYKSEINKALKNHDTDYNLSIKIMGTENSSKQLDLTLECIDALQNELTSIKLAYLVKNRNK